MANLGTLSALLRLEGVGQMQTGLANATGAVEGLRSNLGSIMGPLAAATAAIAGVASVGEILRASIKAASDMEGFEVGFSVLLGSMDKAKARMADLAKFAQDTPFELPEVISASRTLETLTHGALATGAGLRLVGDVASGTGQPFAELSTQIGRMYDGLDSGRPVGEAMQRLQELGIIGGETRDKIEALQKSGQKGASVWSVAAGAFSRYSGMMQAQSATIAGKWSNLQDAIGAAFREFGKPINDAIKPILDGAINLVGKLAPMAARAGQEMGGALTVFYNAFQGGKLGELFGASLELGSARALNYLAAAMGPVGQALNAALGAAFGGLLDGLGDGLQGVAILLGAALLNAFENPVRYLQAGVEQAIQFAQNLRDRALGKSEDTSAAGMMSPAERQRMGDQIQAQASRRFDELAATTPRGGLDAALANDPKLRSLQAQADQLKRYDPSKYATRVEPLDDIMARHAADPVRVGGGSTAADLEDAGAAKIRDAKANLASSLFETGVALRKFLADFKLGTDGEDGPRKAFDKLWASLSNGVQTAADTASGKKTSGAATVGALATPKLEGDRLARIGGFIGGAGGPALDFARRAAVATEKTADHVAKLVAYYTSTDGKHVQVWG